MFIFNFRKFLVLVRDVPGTRSEIRHLLSEKYFNVPLNRLGRSQGEEKFKRDISSQS